MLFPRMSMQLLPPSRLRGQSSSLTGAQLGSRLGSTTSLPQLYQEEIWPRFPGLSACCPTPRLLLRPGPGLTTSLISCMPRELLFTGMLERVWRRESSLRLVRILLLWRRIMRRLDLTLPKLKMEKVVKNTNL